MRGGTQKKIVYTNGSTYDGEVNDHDQRNGEGKLTFSDGREYVGMFKDDMMDGEGTYTFPNGLKQEGMFSKNLPNGKGKLSNSETGEYYEGDYVNNKKHGSGTYNFANGDKYVGKWEDDMRNGSGNMTWRNRDKYVGEWKDNMRNGEGTLTSANGAKYVGEWKDDKEHGHGAYKYPGGESTYVGEFESGKFSGLGVYTNVTPGYVFEYRGNHEDDFRHGEGIIKTICKGKIERMFVTYEKERMMSGKGRRIEPNGTINEGDFKDKKLIDGIQTKPDGTIDTGHFENSIIQEGTRISSDNTYKYVGEFKNGKPDGMGSMISMDEANGWKYEGPFKNGLREGYGKFTLPDGRIYEGIFKNDQPVRPVQRDEIKKLDLRNLMSAELGMSKQIFNDTRMISDKKRRELKHAAKTEGGVGAGGVGAEVSTMKHS